MDEHIELRIVGEIGQIRLQEGDSILVTCPGAITSEQARRIADSVKKVYAGFPVVILDSGMKMEVLRPALELSE